MFEETIQNLIALLENESNTAIEWFQNNKMMVNPGKFQAIIIDKKKKCHTNETLEIGNKIIKASSSSVNRLGVQIDDQLNFNLHISNICRSAANQLSALIRLKRFLDFEEKKILVTSTQIATIVPWFGCFLVLNHQIRFSPCKKELFVFYLIIMIPDMSLS